MLMILNSRKKIRKLIESLDKTQLKQLKFILISDDLKKHDFPKKMDVSNHADLLPPSYMIVNLIQEGDRETYANKYTEYLFSYECQRKLLYIVYEALTNKHVILCFGDTETEFSIDVYVKSVLCSILEDLDIYKYKDFKDNFEDFINLDLDEDDIVRQVESCIKHIESQMGNSMSDPYDNSTFYID